MASSLSSDVSPTPHLDVLRVHWRDLTAFRSGSLAPLVDGTSFSLAAVIAASRFGVVPELDESTATLERVSRSANYANAFVAASKDNPNPSSMYGVTTGFGSSYATTLQRVLIKGLRSGIIPLSQHSPFDSSNQDFPALGIESLLMPESWTKGAIAIRLNSLIRGHSGCRFDVMRALHALLANNITPCPPLRMSVSASGDLGPLAYIAGSLVGEGNCMVWSGEGPARKRIPARQVLAQHNLKPISLNPKEGLAIVNGTAPSCSVAAAALHDAHFVFLLSQACTALCVEVLSGSQESFIPFLHDVARPHPGQVEVAANIRRALAGSRLAKLAHDELDPEQRLRQDRYSIRTAPQWLGPQVEEALAAHRTILQEINATTDNPLIDSSAGGAGGLSGGNFQGTSITVAMEKVRIGLQHIGRMAYAQIVELGQPSMSQGLSHDLAAGEPSADYGQKALDIAAASYLSELSFISNTVSNHVQPAEMHNQSVNSLALVSARYTATAVQLAQMILTNELLSLCQAVDLRAMYRRFFAALPTTVADALAAHITPPLPPADQAALAGKLVAQVRGGFGATASLDTDERFAALVRPLVADVFAHLPPPGGRGHGGHAFDAPGFHGALARDAAGLWRANRAAYFADEGAPAAAAGLLGRTRALYLWVRTTLGVPMGRGTMDGEETDLLASRIYEGVVRGDVNGVLLGVLCGEGEGEGM